MHSAVLARLLRTSVPMVLKTSCCEELSVMALRLVLALLPLPEKAVISKKLPFSPIRTQEFTKRPFTTFTVSF